jgi:hypothetical protein
MLHRHLYANCNVLPFLPLLLSPSFMFICLCLFCVSTIFYHFTIEANLCNFKYVLLYFSYPLKHDEPFPSPTWIQILPNSRFIEFLNHASGTVSSANFFCVCVWGPSCWRNSKLMGWVIVAMSGTGVVERIGHKLSFSGQNWSPRPIWSA